jgi:hypothetical protein
MSATAPPTESSRLRRRLGWLAVSAMASLCVFLVIDSVRLLSGSSSVGRAKAPAAAINDSRPSAPVTTQVSAPAALTAVVARALPIEPLVLHGNQIDDSDKNPNTPDDPLFADGGRPAKVRTLVKVGHIRAGIRANQRPKDDKPIADILERAAHEMYALDLAEGVDTKAEPDADIESMLPKYTRVMARYQLELRQYITGRFEFGVAGRWMLEMDTREDVSRFRS